MGPWRSPGPTSCDLPARECPPCLIPSNGGELTTSPGSSVLSPNRSHGSTRLLLAVLLCAPSFIPHLLSGTRPACPRVKSGLQPLLCGGHSLNRELPISKAEQVHTSALTRIRTRQPAGCSPLAALWSGTALQKPQPTDELLPGPCSCQRPLCPEAPLPAGQPS